MDKHHTKISIVTPSYNQAKFLEDCICSVLNQNCSNIEHVIIDGASTDGSVSIIRKHEDHLAYWVSEPDKGQYDALNKGFAKTTGEIMAWLNSDDKYTAWALSVVADVFSCFPEVEWITSAYPIVWNEKGQAIGCHYCGGFNRKSFLRGANLCRPSRYAGSWIQQESTFWRRSLWERAGSFVEASLQFAGDFELWARFFQYADIYAVGAPLGGFRSHGNQKTMTCMGEYLAEAENVLLHYGGKPYGKLESMVRRYGWYVLGNRSLKRLPTAVGSLLTRLSVLYPVKTCTWMGDKWQIVTDYAV
ncbi:MAG: glycosyltransferase [Proteobacteria bacterium]|nr:glycosyltransferase [Pseudomonadota bacterium]